MKFLTWGLFATILLGIYSYSYAQTGSPVIQGNIVVGDHAPAVAATVILLAAKDSSIIKSTTCDNEGLFTFNVKPGKYIVLATTIGYNQYLSNVLETIGDQNILMGNITLIRSVPQLKEVVITAKKPYIDARPGKIILNVGNSIIAEGNSVIDILRQAPGVHVGTQGNISIIGKLTAMVMIDNKPANLSGENLTSYLQSLQSSAIQQVELITNPSARYDAAGGGIINIITKKGTRMGTNGAFNINYGYGRFYKSSVGLVFNDRTKKVNTFINYNYSENKTFHTIITDRLIDYKGNISGYNSNYYNTQQNTNHTFKAGADYFITPQHTLGVIISGTVNNSDFIKTNSLQISNHSTLDSLIAVNSRLSRDLCNINYDINYAGRLDTLGQILTADFSFNHIDRESSEYIGNNFYNAAGSSYRQPLYLQNLSPSGIRIWAAKVDYIKPLSKQSQLEAGVKFSWVKSDNNMVFGPLVNGAYQTDPKFSNQFIFTENINSGYVNYMNHIGNFNLAAGLRAEQTNSNGNAVTAMSSVKKNYINLFPMVQLTYQYNDKNDFTFGFNRGIDRPLYEDVNPFYYYVDPYDYSSGNPRLLPQYVNRIELSHTYNKTLVTTLYTSFVSNAYKFIVPTQNDSSKVYVTSKRNFGTYAAYGLRFAAPVQFNNWWSAHFDLDASYQRYKAYPANGNLNKGTYSVNAATNQKFNIGETLTFELSGKYESPTFYGIDQFKSLYSVNAGISKQLFDKKGSLTLNITDIFNTKRDQGQINYQNLNISVVDRVESRIARLSFIYRFGNISLKNIMKPNAGSEDEQKRAGGVAGKLVQ